MSRTGLLSILWLVAMTILAPLYLAVPPSPDQSQFDWMAFAATRGLPYYSGSFDMNWPGAMWLHEIGIRLFGVNAWTWRLTDFLLMSGFTVAGAVFLWRSGWRIAPLVFLFLYPPLYVTAGPWWVGQRDIIAAGFLLTACVFALPGGRREGLAALLAGICIALAVLVRPTFLSFLAGLVLLEALPLKMPQPRRLSRAGRALRFCFGVAVGIGGAAVAGLMLGNLDDWYQQSIEFSLSVYVGDPAQDPVQTLRNVLFRYWHWISGLAFLGILGWAWRDRVGYALVLVLGLLATSLVSFFVQNKGFGYHLSGLLPVLVLLASVAFDSLDTLRRAAGRGITRAAALGALVVAAALAVSGTLSKLSTFGSNLQLVLSGDLGPMPGRGLTEIERREVVSLIRDGSTSTDTVAVYGTHYDLAYRAQRLPAYRFFTPAADQITSGFEHTATWLAEIENALEEHPPAFAIVTRSAIAGAIVTPTPAHPDRLVLRRLLDHLSVGYEVAFRNDRIVVYRKRP